MPFLIKNYYESLNYGNYNKNKRTNRKILSKTSKNPYDFRVKLRLPQN